MSVLASLCDGEDVRVVPLGDMRTVGELCAAIHGVLDLPRAAGDYRLVVVGGAGGAEEDESVLESAGAEAAAAAPLEGIGIHGCDERVRIVLDHTFVARERLREAGVVSRVDAHAAFLDALGGEPVALTRVGPPLTPPQATQRAVDWERVMLLAAAKLCVTPPLCLEKAVIERPDAIAPLLRGYVDVNAPSDATCRTPLWYAVDIGRPDVVQLLIDHGADVNVPDWERTTPLMLACKHRSLEMTRALLTHGADTEVKVRFRHDTALQIAAEGGDFDLVALLIAHGADVNAASAGARTPLAHAARTGGSRTVECLLAHGADPNAGAGNAGATPLCAARELHVVRALLAHGADPCLGAPLVCAIASGGSGPDLPAIVRTLLAAGVDVNARGRHRGETALGCAARMGRGDVVRLLLDRGAAGDSERGGRGGRVV